MTKRYYLILFWLVEQRGESTATEADGRASLGIGRCKQADALLLESNRWAVNYGTLLWSPLRVNERGSWERVRSSVQSDFENKKPLNFKHWIFMHWNNESGFQCIHSFDLKRIDCSSLGPQMLTQNFIHWILQLTLACWIYGYYI